MELGTEIDPNICCGTLCYLWMKCVREMINIIQRIHYDTCRQMCDKDMGFQRI